MENCKESCTPMSTSCYTDAYLAGKVIYQTKFRGLFGSFLYLIASSCQINLEASQRHKQCWFMVYFLFSYKFVRYSDFDFDFAGCKLDRKSKSGTCRFLGSSLISWHSKKQACVVFSTVEAKYIVVSNCCSQILWIKKQLEDFGLKLTNVPLLYDNTTINLTNNKIQHGRTKHIEI